MEGVNYLGYHKLYKTIIFFNLNKLWARGMLITEYGIGNMYSEELMLTLVTFFSYIILHYHIMNANKHHFGTNCQGGRIMSNI